MKMKGPTMVMKRKGSATMVMKRKGRATMVMKRKGHHGDEEEVLPW